MSRYITAMFRATYVFTIYIVIFMAAVVGLSWQSKMSIIYPAMLAGNVAAIGLAWLSAWWFTQQVRRHGFDFMQRSPSGRDAGRLVVAALGGLAVAMGAIRVCDYMGLDAVDTRRFAGIFAAYAAVGALLGGLAAVRRIEIEFGRHMYTWRRPSSVDRTESENDKLSA